MQEIQGQAKTVHEVLAAKYTVDFYQREYKWETKQIVELIDDVAVKFLEDYRSGQPREAVAGFGRYFLGSIIISKKNNTNYIVDGQQRLTSLTLLLIYLRNRLVTAALPSEVDSLISSIKFGRRSFNLDVPERTPALEALFERRTYDESGQPESVQTILARYADIEDNFPSEIDDAALPYFVDWLVENVNVVEITAYSDDDAYTIFETMNDRGLSLTPTDMLKGFLLANITDEQKKTVANDMWKKRTEQLRDFDRETESDFFKAWLRSRYADRIRDRTKGAKAEDFDRIGTEFHRWVREHASDRDEDRLTLKGSDAFFDFIHRDLDFYARRYLTVMEASRGLVPTLEHVFYNATLGFTLQPMLLLAPMRTTDSEKTANQKARLVAMFLEILLVRRIWNFRTIAYSTLQYAMFLVMRDIRDLDVHDLANHLHARLTNESQTFASNDRLSLHQQNRWQLHWLLARMTDYVERASGLQTHYDEYVGGTGRARYEVEHIWANKPDEHADEFPHAADFAEYRNRFGGLVLLPKSFNASFGAMPYGEKVKYYGQQNLLAFSLHPDAYSRNPGFLQFIQRSGLPFGAKPAFDRADLDERQALYRALAEEIWNPDKLLDEVGLGFQPVATNLRSDLSPSG